jgi:hypothetical protein
MAASDRISQVLVEVDIASTSLQDRISRLIVEVDVNDIARPCRVTQLLLEVDILVPDGRSWGPAAGIM